MNDRDSRTWTITLAPSHRLVTIALATALAILGAATFSVLAQPRSAGANASMVTAGKPVDGSLEFTKQGKVSFNTITVSSGVTSPRDAASGQAAGKRQHQPVVITKQVDAATPNIFQALTTNEVIKEAKFHIGDLTITLKNATVSEQKLTGNKDSGTEQVSITYQTIMLEGFSKSAEDSWSSSAR